MVNFKLATANVNLLFDYYSFFMEEIDKHFLGSLDVSVLFWLCPSSELRPLLPIICYFLWALQELNPWLL